MGSSANLVLAETYTGQWGAIFSVGLQEETQWCFVSSTSGGVALTGPTFPPPAESLEQSKKVTRKVPKGTSAYQAAWIVDGDEDEDVEGDSGGEEDEEAEGDSWMEEAISQVNA